MLHRLKVDVDLANSKLKFLLFIVKQNRQNLVVDIPNLHIKDFMRAWNHDNLKWRELATHSDGGYFFAIRFVPLEGNRYLVWRVEHTDGIAADMLDFYTGSQEEMLECYGRI